jgi:hypothetical protein
MRSGYETDLAISETAPPCAAVSSVLSRQVRQSHAVTLISAGA